MFLVPACLPACCVFRLRILRRCAPSACCAGPSSTSCASGRPSETTCTRANSSKPYGRYAEITSCYYYYYYFLFLKKRVHSRSSPHPWPHVFGRLLLSRFSLFLVLVLVIFFLFLFLFFSFFSISFPFFPLFEGLGAAAHQERVHGACVRDARARRAGGRRPLRVQPVPDPAHALLRNTRVLCRILILVLFPHLVVRDCDCCWCQPCFRFRDERQQQQQRSGGGDGGITQERL